MYWLNTFENFTLNIFKGSFKDLTIAETVDGVLTMHADYVYESPWLWDSEIRHATLKTFKESENPIL